jgi:hypothetical protein
VTTRIASTTELVCRLRAPPPVRRAFRSTSDEQDDQDDQQDRAQSAADIRATDIKSAATEHDYKYDKQEYQVHGFEPPMIERHGKLSVAGATQSNHCRDELVTIEATEGRYHT